MEVEPPFTLGIAAITFPVLLGGILLILGLMLRDTIRQRGNWGINVKRVVCTQCGTPMPMVRKPANWRQTLWGGGTCPECGFELDKWGRPIEGQNTPAKWNILRAIEEEEPIERRPKRRDERIREANNRMQQGSKKTQAREENV